MNNLPNIEEENLQQYWEVLRRLDPELYLIKIALEETRVNARIMPRIIRSIANLAYGTQFGKIQIFMQAGVITAVKPEESDVVNLDALEE